MSGVALVTSDIADIYTITSEGSIVPLIASTSHTTAVFLFGDEACRQCKGILDSMRLALEENAWSDFVFVRIYNNKSLADFKVDIPQLSGFNLPCQLGPDDKGIVQVPQNIIETLATKLRNDKPLQIHCVCGDFANPTMPADYPVRFAKAVCDHFRAAHPNIFFYAPLHDSSTAIDAQRSFALAVSEPCLSAHLIPFLFTTTFASGAKVSDFDIWRSIAWLIITNSIDSLNGLKSGHLYSVDYNSINARDSELTDLQIFAVKERLNSMRQIPIRPDDAWQLLTNRNSQPTENELITSNHLYQRTAEWLTDLAGKYFNHLLNDKKRILDNLQNLTRLDDVSEIDHILCSFYGCNIIIPASQDQHLPGVFIRNLILRDLRRHLTTTFFRLPNLEFFPISEIHALIDALKAFKEAPLPMLPRPSFSKKGLFTKKSVYLSKCLEARDAAIRKRYVALFCRQIIDDLVSLYEGVASAVNELQHNRELEQRLTSDALGYINYLRNDKYPDYWNNLQTVLNSRTQLFGNQWGDATLSCLAKASTDQQLYLASGRLNLPVYNKLITNAQRTLISNLPFARGNSFIDVLNSIHHSAEAMNDFIHRHLRERGAMFSATGSQLPEQMRTFYFLDRSLQNHPWVTESPAEHNRFTINNDNVECMHVYDLHLTLQQLMIGENIMLNNPFAPLLGNEAQSGGQSFHWGVLSNDSLAEQTPLNDAAPKKPEQMIFYTLNADGNLLYLSWKWRPGDTHMKYQINNGSIIPIALASRGIGIPLTPQNANLRYGRNDVVIHSSMCEEPYAKASIPGLMQPVTFSVSPSELRVLLPAREPNGKYNTDNASNGPCEFWETNAELQLALLTQPGSENMPCLLYPVRLCQSNVTNSKQTVIFSNLRVGSGAKLIHSPNYHYPTLLP